jgi:hypothetical protein
LLWIDIKQQGNIKKILVWLIKKVLKTGSFSGISLPVYVLNQKAYYKHMLIVLDLHLFIYKDAKTKFKE